MLDGAAHWRQLVNTTELSVCGGDAGFLFNYYEHLLILPMFLLGRIAVLRRCGILLPID